MSWWQQRCRYLGQQWCPPGGILVAPGVSPPSRWLLLAPRGSLWLLVPPSGGPCWIPNATLVLLYGHASATLLPLHCNSVALLLPLYDHSTVPLFCHSTYHSNSTVPPLCHSTAILLLPYCHSCATLLPFFCLYYHSTATLLPLLGHSTGTLLPLTSNLGPRQPKSSLTYPTLGPVGPDAAASQKLPSSPLTLS